MGVPLSSASAEKWSKSKQTRSRRGYKGDLLLGSTDSQRLFSLGWIFFRFQDMARFRGMFSEGAIAGFSSDSFSNAGFDQLKLPAVLRKIIKRPNGLILVTSPTGSGKSTTLASLLDILNLEFGHDYRQDPIEFVHQHKNCVVNQGWHGHQEFRSRSNAFCARTDFILVGELGTSRRLKWHSRWRRPDT